MAAQAGMLQPRGQEGRNKGGSGTLRPPSTLQPRAGGRAHERAGRASLALMHGGEGQVARLHLGQSDG